MQATTLSHIASLFQKQAKGIDWAIVLVPEGSNEGSSLFLASFPGSHAPEREIEVVQAWRAWYFLSREKRQR